MKVVKDIEKMDLFGKTGIAFIVMNNRDGPHR
jgi:hypothetical protein